MLVEGHLLDVAEDVARFLFLGDDRLELGQRGVERDQLGFDGVQLALFHPENLDLLLGLDALVSDRFQGGLLRLVIGEIEQAGDDRPEEEIRRQGLVFHFATGPFAAGAGSGALRMNSWKTFLPTVIWLEEEIVTSLNRPDF